VFSHGWVQGFKRRYNIKQRVRHGEAGSIDEAAIAAQLVAVQAAIRNFKPCDIYNCDETGLFWKTTPDRGLSSQRLSGQKSQKARITIHFGCNADGSDELPPWFIGRAAQPRAFGAANVSLNSLDCFWRHNGTAWMTASIMTEWPQCFDRRCAGRKMLLIMDVAYLYWSAINALVHLYLNKSCWDVEPADRKAVLEQSALFVLSATSSSSLA